MYDFDDTKVSYINTLIILGSITLGFNAIYFLIIFIPALCSLLQRKRRILTLFTQIPKDIVGEIYQKLESRHKASAVTIANEQYVCSSNLIILSL